MVMFVLNLVNIPAFYLKLVVSITRALRLSNISKLFYLFVSRAFTMRRTTTFFYRTSNKNNLHTIGRVPAVAFEQNINFFHKSN